MPEAVDEVATRKKTLRLELRQRRRELPEDELRAASEAVCRHVWALRCFATAQSVALYAATPGEVDITSLAPHLEARGATVSWPRVVSRDPAGLMFHAASLGALVRDAMGIPTPPADCPEIPLSTVDLVLVPGVAFDAVGRRLGQGGGYYDHALAAAPNAVRIGVCHGFQLIDAVPYYDADVAMDVIVTPDGARRTGVRPHPSLEDLT
jgi:5-formyltetrahydrofolate cyclo-ligase